MKFDRSKLTDTDVTALCDAAQAVWTKAGPNATRVAFTWRGQKFVVTHSSFRLCVDTIDGQPVATRYAD